MKLLVWNDGQVVEVSNFVRPASYVLQRIHTIGYRAYHVSRHILIMREATARLYGYMSLCKVEDVERIITKLLELSRVSPLLSCAVAMRLDPYGHLSFEVEMPTYYEGMTMRAKRLRAVSIIAEKSEELAQTSVTVAIDDMCDSRILGRGDIALWVDGKSNVISRPWRPIFAIYRGRVYTPQEFESVEYVATCKAIKALDLKLEVRSIPLSVLLKMDEVFMVDIMGVSSFVSVDKRQMFYVNTSQIAGCIEPHK